MPESLQESAPPAAGTPSSDASPATREWGEAPPVLSGLEEDGVAAAAVQEDRSLILIPIALAAISGFIVGVVATILAMNWSA